MGAIYTKIQQMKPEWVFFDLFDTIIHRNHSPEEIKYVWAKRMVNRLNIDCSVEKLHEIRLEAVLRLIVNFPMICFVVKSILVCFRQRK